MGEKRMTTGIPAERDASGFKLQRHAVQRVLERSGRAPSWLVEVLEKKQFAHLHVGTDSGKRYVLVFDSIANSYLVPIVAPDNLSVITVLTSEQYENTNGAIPPVFFQLSQLARVQRSPEEQAIAAGAAQGVVEEKRPDCWSARWCVRFTLQLAPGKKRKFNAPLGTSWRQDCLLRSASAKGEQALGPDDIRDLGFDTLAALLAQSPEFLEWAAFDLRNRGKPIEKLTHISIMSNHSLNAEVDVTHELSAQLVA